MTDTTENTDGIIALIERLVVAGVTPDKAAEEAFRWDARKSRAKSAKERAQDDPVVRFFSARKSWQKPSARQDVKEAMRMFDIPQATAYRRLRVARGDTAS
jgi:predicted nucleotidyltransferase